MALGKTVRALRNSRGWRLEDLSERTGVKVGTLGAMELRDGTKSEYAPQIAAAFGLTLDALLSAEVDSTGNVMFPTVNLDAIPQIGDGSACNEKVTYVSSVTKVPIVEWDRIRDFVTSMFSPPSDRFVLSTKRVSSKCFALALDSDAMVSAQLDQSIPSGTLLLCDPEQKVKSGDLVIAEHPKTGLPVFRKIVKEAGVWLLQANNSGFLAIEVSGPECVIARVYRVSTERDV